MKSIYMTVYMICISFSKICIRVSQHALFFKVSANVSSWFTGLFALYYQRFALFSTEFGFNVWLALTIIFFHLLSEFKVRLCLSVYQTLHTADVY